LRQPCGSPGNTSRRERHATGSLDLRPDSYIAQQARHSIRQTNSVVESLTRAYEEVCRERDELYVENRYLRGELDRQQMNATPSQIVTLRPERESTRLPSIPTPAGHQLTTGSRHEVTELGQRSPQRFSSPATSPNQVSSTVRFPLIDRGSRN